MMSEAPMMNNEVYNHSLTGMTPAEIAEHLKDICPEFGDLNVEEVLLMQESAFLYIQDNKTSRNVTSSYGETSSRSLVLAHGSESSLGTGVESQLALDEALARALEFGDDFNDLCVHEHGGIAVDNTAPSPRETPVRRENQNIRQDEIDPDRMTYEELQSLGDFVGTENRGLTADLISRLPTFKYKVGLFSKRKKKEKQECVICYSEYKNGAKVTTLPCAHQYHSGCITHWLQLKKEFLRLVNSVKRMMNCSRDFIEWIGQDLSLKIFMCLNDPSDLVRASAVSSSWRQFVITNGLCRQLCVRMFPEASHLAYVVEIKNTVEPVATEKDISSQLTCLESEHRAYASLSRGFTTFPRKNCISDALYASSTDHYPRESIKNTLEPGDRVDNRASYWSSKGSNSAAPETLIYKLVAQLCLVSEFHMHPFQAYYQSGFPIYSPKAVRFQMGYPNVPLTVENDDGEEFMDVNQFSDDKFVWAYTSPEFPMAQENHLQKFKLPEPVLCIGGILKVELLGKVQTQESDGLYYICIANVQAVGRALSPAFDVEMLNEPGKYKLNYYPESAHRLLSAKSLE
ncbi:hypothetical protein BUALT_Bualt01G0068600 [Buddleja alternifolia]|uniref:RING-type domain-containing protein n=1 Tax=Buddleja alternifolia TaxID=168488 RepID=A0AAV6Y644_9LAMI|nr:hypothetical protein BUALT_Bualt01G0068600 [Buddleja alternifolia]